VRVELDVDRNRVEKMKSLCLSVQGCEVGIRVTEFSVQNQQGQMEPVDQIDVRCQERDKPR